MEQQRKLDVEIELRTRAENKVMDLITHLEQEQMAKVQLAQNSHHLNERLAFYERQLKDAKDKLVSLNSSKIPKVFDFTNACRTEYSVPSTTDLH